MTFCPYCRKLGIWLHVVNVGVVSPMLIGGLPDPAPVIVAAGLIVSWTASALAVVLYFNADA